MKLIKYLVILSCVVLMCTTIVVPLKAPIYHNIVAPKNLGTLPMTLKPGDTIGIIASASPPHDKNNLILAKKQLEKMGFKVILGKHILTDYHHSWRHFHLTSSERDRALDVMEMFKNNNVKAIIEFRGGEGSEHILKWLDYKQIKQHPKIIIGFSDTTALTLGIYAKTGLVTFNGPMGMMTWTDFTKKYFEKTLMQNSKGLVFDEYEPIFDRAGNIENPQYLIHGGIATGNLIGGNLSALNNLLDGPYFPQFNHTILFVEDINEKQLYKLDKLFRQLKNAGVLRKLSGFVFASCSKCNLNKSGYITLNHILDKYIKPLGIPAYSGSMVGHFDTIYTIPIGVNAQINADQHSITLLQSATIP